MEYDKIEFEADYIAKDKFGFRISYTYPFIIIHLEVYDESKWDEILDIFKKFANHIFEDNKDKGIKKIFLVDSKDVRAKIARNEERFKNRENFIIETLDLISGDVVPLLSKIKELK